MGFKQFVFWILFVAISNFNGGMQLTRLLVHEELALVDSLMIDIEKCEAQLPRDQMCTYQVIPMERYNGKQDRETESSS